MTAYKRGYTVARCAFEMDGRSAGWLYGFEGGLARGDVHGGMRDQKIVQRVLSGIKYDDITLTCGLGMSQGFYRWVADSFQQESFTRRNGALVAADFDLRERTRLDFHEALLKELTLPACDASALESAKLQIKMSPEWTRMRHYNGMPGPSIAGSAFPIHPQRSKQWLTRNFRLRIDGLDGCCRRANQLEAITFKQHVLDLPLGELRDSYREPMSIEHSDVVFSVPEVDAGPLFDWYDAFVVDGKCEMERQLTGEIEYLAEDTVTTVFSVQLAGLGIFSLTTDKAEAGSERMRRVRVSMYCDAMKLDLNRLFS